jgi:hypothetical protein
MTDVENEIEKLERALKAEREMHIEGVKLHAEFMHDVYLPAEARIKELEEGLRELTSYTMACEGLLNCSEAGQVKQARELLGEDDESGT